MNGGGPFRVFGRRRGESIRAGCGHNSAERDAPRAPALDPVAEVKLRSVNNAGHLAHTVESDRAKTTVAVWSSQVKALNAEVAKAGFVGTQLTKALNAEVVNARLLSTVFKTTHANARLLSTVFKTTQADIASLATSGAFTALNAEVAKVGFVGTQLTKALNAEVAKVRLLSTVFKPTQADIALLATSGAFKAAQVHVVARSAAPLATMPASSVFNVSALPDELVVQTEVLLREMSQQLRAFTTRNKRFERITLILAVLALLLAVFQTVPAWLALQQPKPAPSTPAPAPKVSVTVTAPTAEKTTQVEEHTRGVPSTAVSPTATR
jgi:hypothetical protein